VSRGPVVADMVRAHARQLKMPALARAFEELARQAREEHWTHEEYLVEVLAVEIASRAESAVKQRLRAALFPEMKTLDAFDFHAAEGVSAPKVAELARCSWIDRGDNVLLAGPIGTGKSHLAVALGVEAARQRRRVLFCRAADLVCALIEARDAKELGRYQRRLERVDLLIVDEVGFVPFDRKGGELLFNVLAARHGRRSVIITTNLAFSEWPKVFGSDEKLTTALLDRLAEHATVITTKGKSFRMRRRGAVDSPPVGATSETSESQNTPATKEKEVKDQKDSKHPKDGKKR
jgi:DNA replication protein DnaC